MTKDEVLELFAPYVYGEPYPMYDVPQAELIQLLSTVAPPARTKPVLTVGPFRLIKASRTFMIDDELVHMMPCEFELMWLFCSSPNIVLSYDHIRDIIWPKYSKVSVHQRIHQQVYKIRQIIACCSGISIVAEYCHGYKLHVPDLLKEAANEAVDMVIAR